MHSIHCWLCWPALCRAQRSASRLGNRHCIPWFRPLPADILRLGYPHVLIAAQIEFTAEFWNLQVHRYPMHQLQHF
ncbi:hypothetical protein BDZ91DRAFT_708746 [Kalaharituber pfeilii]|nr:hypothetical protein BDZ91DRAFT_708746 [Kalaharituber pfeilii]